MISYRKEIDGLRAIAVIPVVFFHAGISSFSGGYVGVDVFFVISGYLITSLIVAEKEKAEFSIINFYERRARRLLPALFFMSLVCVPFSLLLMSPIQLKEFSDSLISIPLFVSNFVFWSESGYFSTAAEEKPLLHTWSLAVEEQYYLIFPIFILMFWKFKKAILISIIFIISIFSILIAQFGSNLASQPPFYDEVFRYNAIPDFAFFLAPTRAWELLFGSLTAFFLLKEKKDKFFINQILSLTGMFMILFSIIAFDSTTPFPGFSALIPVLGTVLIIIYAREGTLIYKALTLRPLVFFGLISYSIYLWHQPLFAFVRLSTINSPSVITYLILSFISFFLGWLSWKYIEAPFRKKDFLTRKQIFISSLTVGLFIVLIGVIGVSSNGFIKRFSTDELQAIQPEKFDNSICKWTSPIEEFPNLEFCEFGDLNSLKKPIVLYGDSHADSLTASLDITLKEKKLKGIKILNSYCEPIIGFYKKVDANIFSKNRCEKVFSKILKEIKKINAKHVIIFNRWSFRFFPVKDQISQLNFNNEEGGIEYVKNYREYLVYDGMNFTTDGESKKKTLNRFIKSFLDKEIRVKLIYPLPEVGWNLSKLNMVSNISKGSIPDKVSTSFQVFLKRQNYANYVLDSLKDSLFLERIYLDKVFCDEILKDRCMAQIDGVPFYYDSNHLSNKGADVLIKNTNLVR